MKNWCRRCTSLIVLVSMLTFSIYSPALAAAPAVPYGAAANNNFSKVIYDYWWNNLINKITDVTWNIPVFNESVHGKMLSQTANPYVTTQEEMMDFIRSLPDTYMRWDVIGSVTTYDTSTETNPPRQPLRNFEFPLVVFSKPPVFDPAELKALNKPIYYVHGSVHANEPSGYEALLLIMQKLSTDEFHILDRISVVIAPRYNLDGAYWFQRGTNTIRGINNVDQNRDGTMFASPQTRIINSILNAYRPEMGLDPHEMGYGDGGNERYYASGVRGDGPTTTYTKATPVNNPDSSATMNMAKYSKYALWNFIDLGNRFWNLPDFFKTWNSRMITEIKDRMLNEKGIYTFQYLLTGQNAWRDTSIYIVSTDLNPYTYPGEVSQYWAVGECTPDEGYGDGALGLKGVLELCAETPGSGAIHADGFKTRVYAHYSGMEYMMKFLAEHADEIRNGVGNAHASMAADRSDIVLWSVQNPSENSIKTLRLNAARDAVEGIEELKINKYYDNLNNTPGPSVTRPYAYFIDGSASADNHMINADLAAFRLAYTGVPIMRLTEPVTVQVEGSVVNDIQSLGYQSNFGYSSAPALYEDGTPKTADPEWNPGQYYLGAIDTAGSSFGIQRDRIIEATTATETKTFPAGTYVVPMNHVSSLHASLMLEPLGKRNMGNTYWYFTQTNQTANAFGYPQQYSDNFFPVAIGAKFPAYRYMSSAALPTERVFTEQPFLRGANFAQGYPVNASILREKGINITLDQIDMGYHFKGEGTYTMTINPPVYQFDILLPAARDGVTLDTWYLYNWNTNAFEETAYSISPTSGARYVNVAWPYVEDSEVIAVAKTAAAPKVALTGISVPDELELDIVAPTYNLTPTALPENAAEPVTFSYASDNATVAGVDESGKITARSVGQAVITITAANEVNSVSATCAVTVKDSSGGDTPKDESGSGGCDAGFGFFVPILAVAGVLLMRKKAY